MLGLVPSSYVKVCIERVELCAPVLSYNFSMEVPSWKVLCGYNGNSSVWRRGRRAVARTSRHITVFAFDLFSLFYILHCLTLFMSYTCLVLFVCPQLYWTKKASNSTSTLNLEKSWGVVPEPFTGNSDSLLVTLCVFAI